jgi:tetratricopeptide (TPR) repeat protein
MRRHRGCGVLQLNSDPWALKEGRFLRDAGNALLRVCALLAVAALLGLSAGAQSGSSQAADAATIRGMVHSSAGQPVGDAEVRLAQKGVEGAVQTRTDAAGAFAFSSIKPGTYELSAEKAGLHSRTMAVTAVAHADAAKVDLVLEDAESASAAAKGASAAQAMEFADKPNFTVAAVTDWTAAGGHGSDSVLRTSEALTRETVALKPSDAGNAGAGNAGVGSANAGDAHRLAGEADEKRGDPLAAVHEFEKAVREDPSEQNYFEWGSELLLHRAVWQAKAVFAEGAKAYPKSERMLTALGTALFSGALYDEAALRLCDASDLNPADPEPYIFMGKIELAAPNPLACVEQKLARFVREQPENALANYYYAMTVWKQQGQPVDPKVLGRVEAMLTKAVTLDPKCAEGYLQLGNLHASQRDYANAIDFYEKAIAANPGLIEAHYRLGVAYDRTGERAKAKEEFLLHDQIQKQQAAEVDRQRREVKQFLVVEEGKPTYPPGQ